MYNFVSNLGFKSELMKSKYFKTSLGVASSKIDRSGERVVNQDDEFAFFWNNKYKTPVYKQGTIGDINFYTDHYMKIDEVYVVHKKQVSIFKIEQSIIKENGIDFYLGHILKKMAAEDQNKVDSNEQEKKEADPNLITMSPGSVKYDDLKAYLDKRNKERFTS